MLRSVTRRTGQTALEKPSYVLGNIRIACRNIERAVIVELVLRQAVQRHSREAEHVSRSRVLPRVRLRRRIGRRAELPNGLPSDDRSVNLRNAEVGNLGRSRVVDQNVLGLDIAVPDWLWAAMCKGKGAKNR